MKEVPSARRRPSGPLRGRAEWDAIVVGAGPAGATTAALLAERGHAVLLVDRTDFPRTKACGESINPGAVRELERLGLLADVLRLRHGQVSGWRIHGHKGSDFEGRFPPEVSGLAIDRRAFDHLLVRHAIACGAVFRPGTHVRDLLRENDRVVGVTHGVGGELRATLVIGADGLRSVVSRRLGLLRGPPKLRKVGLSAHMAGDGMPIRTGELYLRSEGCVGIVGIGEGQANAVVILSAEAIRHQRVGADRLFDDVVADIPALRNARRVGPVQATGPFDFPTNDVVAEGALLVGDAAGYFDPFTGQGIFRALRGASFAADAAHETLTGARDPRLTLRRYAARHRAAFRRGEALQRVIERVISTPGLFAAAALGFRWMPRTANMLLALTGDLRSVSGARDRRTPWRAEIAPGLSSSSGS